MDDTAERDWREKVCYCFTCVVSILCQCSGDNARLAFVSIKIKFMEHTRAWLLNSSCSDVLLAMQE